MKFVNFLKSRLIFIILLFLSVSKQTFRIPHMRLSEKVKGILMKRKSKRYFNVKSSTHYFHIKTMTLTDFQICIRVPLTGVLRYTKIIVITPEEHYNVVN